MDVQTGILDNYSDTRLARLEAETIARKFSTEASWLRNRIDQIIAGIENRVIERILVSRLRKAMRHSASEAAAEKLISEMRTDYETGALETMPSFFPRKYHAVPDDQHGTPANKKNWRQRLLYVPGGGFIFPPSRKQKSMLQRLSQETDSEVIVGTHRLAPEEPFPAAPNDIAQRFIALTGEDETDEPLFLGADTAGASVALGAVQLLKAKNARLPDGIILFSPWCDLSLSGWSYITRSFFYSTNGSLVWVSLFTGNLQGKFVEFGCSLTTWFRITAILQQVTAEFPKQKNRELNFSKREMICHFRETVARYQGTIRFHASLRCRLAVLDCCKPGSHCR